MHALETVAARLRRQAPAGHEGVTGEAGVDRPPASR